MSYGIAAYGTSPNPYGCVVADLSISNVRAISTNVIRVTFTKEPQNIVAALPGDVYNLRTWKITRDDTGVGFTILSVSEADFPLVWDVRVLEDFGSRNVQHTVSAADLLDTTGSPIDAPRTGTFQGVLDKVKSSPELKASTRRYNVRDINNPPAPTDTNPDHSVFIIGNDGDYQLHEGPDFIRKLIFRRLMTQKGGFFHLPNYGVGLAVKQPLPSGDLIKLQEEIRQQVLLEPEVSLAQVQLSQNRNALSVVVRARVEPTGQQISFSLPVPFVQL